MSYQTQATEMARGIADVASIAVSQFFRSVATMSVALLFTFYAWVGFTAAQMELANGDFTGTLGGSFAFVMSVGVVFCASYRLSPSSN